MNKRGRRAFFIAATLGMLVVIVWCTLLRIGGVKVVCNRPPPSPCPMETLLIEESLVPHPLAVRLRGEPAERLGIEAMDLVFTHPIEADGGKVSQTVYRGDNVLGARNAYRELVRTYFRAGDGLFCGSDQMVWEIPVEVTYESVIADRFQLGCTSECPGEPQSCQFIAQYDVYVVWYYAEMSKVVTFPAFERILSDIELRMAQCLARIERE